MACSPSSSRSWPELKVPHAAQVADLKPVLPVFLSYVLSFIYVSHGDQSMNHQLPELRNALLALHKALIDSERVTYEQTIGAIQSPNHFLQLLTRDPWFAWLHPLSQLIVAMDEALDEKEPLTNIGVDALVNQARLLLVASEVGDGFSKHYFDALQRDPDVILAHAEVTKRLGSRRAPT